MSQVLKVKHIAFMPQKRCSTLKDMTLHPNKVVFCRKKNLLLYIHTDVDSPVVLLIFSAGPVNITFADADPRVTAIMQCFFPAQATGDALFSTITMATADASPAGRLPYTWYKTADQVLCVLFCLYTDRCCKYNGYE